MFRVPLLLPPVPPGFIPSLVAPRLPQVQPMPALPPLKIRKIQYPEEANIRQWFQSKIRNTF